MLSSNNLPVLVQTGSGKGSGVRWVPYIGPANGPPAILATARRIEAGIECLTLNVHLISPQMLYARQRDRTLWFGSLIALSSIAAVVGFVSAWRAFRKQQRLSEMKTNFVSSVSHELRAPIASVRLMAESLDRGRI